VAVLNSAPEVHRQTTNLHCPRDGATLEPVLFKQGRLHSCPQCAGGFVPGEVAAQVDRLGRWLENNRAIVQTLPQGEVDCPLQHGPLRQFRLGLHQLDHCTTCSGFWFDKGELKSADAPLHAPSSGAVQSTAATAGEAIGEAGLEIAVEALFWRLG
jgi:Zn-finger nucleic acid-binding protein